MIKPSPEKNILCKNLKHMFNALWNHNLARHHFHEKQFKNDNTIKLKGVTSVTEHHFV